MTSSDRQAKPGKSSRGGDVFIVDNSDADWKVLQYLREWTEIAESFDIATGYFDIGSLVALDGHWQKLDGIRILLGDEVPRRTQQALLAGTNQTAENLDASLEREALHARIVDCVMREVQRRIPNRRRLTLNMEGLQ